MKKRISTQRQWQLTAEVEDDCIEIMEHHAGSDYDGEGPHVIVPIESIDSLIEALQDFKAKVAKE